MNSVEQQQARMVELVERSLALHRLSVARLITLFEDQRDSARLIKERASRALREHPARREAVFIGITGTPGAGKSTLLGALSERLLAADSELRVAVLAVDPSSLISGGALLGDRTRVRVSTDEGRFFFRSQASQTQLGGLSPATYDVCRVLSSVYDCIFVETVGVGQNEVDVRFLVDHLYLVLTPLGGDEVQFLKAGIMEMPDTILINKSDSKQAARRAYYALKASLGLARPDDAHTVEVFRTSCVTQSGLDEAAAHILEQVRRVQEERGAEGPEQELVTAQAKRDAYFFKRWVEREWGRRGLVFLAQQLGGEQLFLREHSSYEQAQAEFGERWLGALARPIAQNT